MATKDNQINSYEITEGLLQADTWNPFEFRFFSYVKCPIQLHFLSTKTEIIGRGLQQAIIDLLDKISCDSIENDTTIIGTEHRSYHSCRYAFKLDNDDMTTNETIELEISSFAPSVFYQLREDINISNEDFRNSFSKDYLQTFTNPGKSGSLMYKTADDLYILKTLREYEAHLLLQILSGYHLKLIQRSTILNRYVGLYSIRFPTILSSTEIYIVIMANAVTSSMKINEIFDLKGSTMKRKLSQNLSIDKLHKLKDLDFTELYPNGICIPSSIHKALRTVISNDTKTLKKLNITDFSLILGIRHIDTTEDELMQSRPSTGVGALLHLFRTTAKLHMNALHIQQSTSNIEVDLESCPVSLLKPLKLIDTQLDTEFFYDSDPIACASYPIPGIVNYSDKRVYLYLAIVDILQTYDCVKQMQDTIKKLTAPERCLKYSVIEPSKYEERMLNFLFSSVFIDAGDHFPWIDGRNKVKRNGKIDDNQNVTDCEKSNFSFDIRL